MTNLSRKLQTQKRHRRSRRFLVGNAARPRLSVYRANNHIYAQVIDEEYFDDFNFEEKLWTIAPAYGLGLVKGSVFSTLPTGYSMNITTPFGFKYLVISHFA